MQPLTAPERACPWRNGFLGTGERARRRKAGREASGSGRLQQPLFVPDSPRERVTHQAVLRSPPRLPLHRLQAEEMESRPS